MNAKSCYQNSKEKQNIYIAMFPNRFIYYCGDFNVCPNIFQYFPLQEEELNSPSLKHGLDLVTHFSPKERGMRGGE